MCLFRSETGLSPVRQPLLLYPRCGKPAGPSPVQQPLSVYALLPFCMRVLFLLRRTEVFRLSVVIRQTFLRLKTGHSRLITTESRNNRAVRSTNELLCPEKLLNSVIFYYGIVYIFSFAVVKWLQKAGKGLEFRKSLLRTYTFFRIIVVNIRCVSFQKRNRAVAPVRQPCLTGIITVMLTGLITALILRNNIAVINMEI